VGQLSDVTANRIASPALVDNGTWSTLKLGGVNLCATQGSEVWCWGQNTSGTLGLGPNHASQLTLVEVPG
jgi:alpha-tubulin suppressor-like RCC1 family protein